MLLTFDQAGDLLDELAEAITKEVMARIDVEELGEAVTKEVTARLVESNRANLAATEPAGAAQDGAKDLTPPAAETPQEGPQEATEAPKPKATRKTPKAEADK